MRKLYFLLLFILPILAQGQSKISTPASVWPELQLNAGVGEDGILFFRNQYRINTDSRYNDLRESGVLSNFERIELTLGYEHTLSEHWRGGAMFRYAAEDFPTSSFYALFVRHNGNLRSLYFNKQVLYEYVDQKDMDPFGQFRLAVEIGKRFPLNNRFITPSISYEALLLSEFKKEEDDNQKKRVVDRTRMRLSLNYELTEKLRLNPYFMRQTDRYYVLVPPEYDEDGQLLKDGYTTKRNRISPIIGVEIKYTINWKPETASITY